MWDWMVLIAKAVAYATTLSAAGGVAFLAYSPPLHAGSDLGTRRLLLRLAIAAAAAGGAKILFTAGSLSGEPSGMVDTGLIGMLLQSGEGWSSGIRLLGLSCIIARRGAGRPSPVALAGAAAAATSFAWVGHVHSLPTPLLPALLLALHLLCAAFWLGALGPLFIVTGEKSVSGMAPVVARFGKAALVVVGVLLLAGAGLVLTLLNAVTDIWRSDYGRLLSLKVGLVAALLSIAAWNRLRLTPRLSAGDGRAAAALRRSVAAEIVLGSVIAGVTAALTTFAGPPRPGG